MSNVVKIMELYFIYKQKSFIFANHTENTNVIN